MPTLELTDAELKEIKASQRISELMKQVQELHGTMSPIRDKLLKLKTNVSRANELEKYVSLLTNDV